MLWFGLHKQVSDTLKRDQTKFEEQKLAVLELAGQKYECGTVWKLIEKMTKKQQTAAAVDQSENLIKVKMLDGSIPRNSGGRLSEWSKHSSK